MRRTLLIHCLAAIIGLSGLLVLVGWIFDVALLKHILPGAVTMKVSTAVSFVFVGSLLWAVSVYRTRQTDASALVITLCSFAMLILMLTIFSSLVFGFRQSVENALGEHADTTIELSVPGIPSAATMADFVLLAFAGIAVLYGGKRVSFLLFAIGIIIAVIGAIAILGYLTKISILYYVTPLFKTGMAVHTAVLFILSGVSLILLSREDHHRIHP